METRSKMNAGPGCVAGQQRENPDFQYDGCTSDTDADGDGPLQTFGAKPSPYTLVNRQRALKRWKEHVTDNGSTFSTTDGAC